VSKETTKTRAQWMDAILAVIADRSRVDTLPQTAMSVAWALSGYINSDSGDAWASQATMAKKSGLEEVSFRKLAARLRELGFLTVTRRGRGSTNNYRLAFPLVGVVDDRSVATGQVVDDRSVATGQVVDGRSVATGQVVDDRSVETGQVVDDRSVEAGKTGLHRPPISYTEILDSHSLPATAAARTAVHGRVLFDKVWGRFPKDKACSRSACASAFARLTPEEQTAFADRIDEISKHIEAQKLPHPHNLAKFISERKFEGFTVEQVAAPAVGVFYIRPDTAQWSAWDKYYRKHKGKSCPEDSNGGWRVPTEYPSEETKGVAA
jgi:hypothetical protein